MNWFRALGRTARNALLGLALTVGLALPTALPARAACNPPSAPAGSIGCLQTLGTPLTTDLILGWRPTAGPVYAGTFTVGQLVASLSGYAVSAGSLTVVGNTTLLGTETVGPSAGNPITITGGASLGTSATLTSNHGDMNFVVSGSSLGYFEDASGDVGLEISPAGLRILVGTLATDNAIEIAAGSTTTANAQILLTGAATAGLQLPQIAGSLVVGVSGNNTITLTPGATPSAAATIAVGGSGGLSLPAGTVVLGNGGAVGLTVNGDALFQSLAPVNGSSVLLFETAPFGAVMMSMGIQGGQPSGQFQPGVPFAWLGNWAWGTSGTTGPLVQNQTFSGTTTNGAAAFGAYLQQTDNSSVAGGADGLLENLILNGSSVVGSRVGGFFQLNINATTGNASAQDYTGLIGKCNLNASDPAGTPAAYSSCFGANTVSSVGPNTHAGQNVGAEIDTWEQSGSVITDIIGLQVVDIQGSTYGVQSSRDDVGMSINNQYAQASTLGFKVGLEFGRQGGFFPVDTTGTLIGAATASGTMNASYGINWTGVTFSTASLAVPGFSILGAGHLSSSGTAPTVSSCGTGPTISGTDTKGTVTEGTGALTSCVVTFASAYATAPVVVLEAGGATAVSDSVAVTTTGFTATFSVSLAGGSFGYMVIQ